MHYEVVHFQVSLGFHTRVLWFLRYFPLTRRAAEFVENYAGISTGTNQADGGANHEDFGLGGCAALDQKRRGLQRRITVLREVIEREEEYRENGYK
jgi:hypothetical protein